MKYAPRVILRLIVTSTLASGLFAAAQSTSAPLQCTSTLSDCAVPENTLLEFPSLTISGDAVLAPNLNSNLNSVRDVFRINNNFVDTGAGTGIGFTGILFSGKHAVPAVASFSANAAEVRETPAGHGDTQYFGNGTDYTLKLECFRIVAAARLQPLQRMQC